MNAGFPADHPMHSHTVQHSVFPDIEIGADGVIADDEDLPEVQDEQYDGGRFASMELDPRTRSRGTSAARPRSAAQKGKAGQL